MPVDPELLEMLACPACRGEISLVQEEKGLECGRCGRVYPVRDGIPIMLVDEAAPPTRQSDPDDTGAPRIP
jgi:hypothetical protein